MDVEVLHGRSSKSLAVLRNVPPTATVEELRRRFQQASDNRLERIAFKSDPKGKLLKDDDALDTLGIKTVYFKDLGPQLGWTTVFLAEYSGPLFIFPMFYIRPALIYGVEAASAPRAPVVTTALLCWTFHYFKRDFETVFIHRFSHGTMPIRNLFKNCSYYWGFAAWIAYLINHPLYTPPDVTQSKIALIGFIFAEIGNFCIHKALRDLRPAGSKVRKIPLPTLNPFTWLFRFVSCPNYSYEVLSWICFTAMTNSAVAGFFTLAGFYQMTLWALGKHRNYIREFVNYPRGRKAIFPFLL